MSPIKYSSFSFFATKEKKKKKNFFPSTTILFYKIFQIIPEKKRFIGLLVSCLPLLRESGEGSMDSIVKGVKLRRWRETGSRISAKTSETVTNFSAKSERL